MYYIKETEPGLFTVGIGDGPNWEPLADYDELQEAKDEVTRLNGGTVLSDVRQTEPTLTKREHFAVMAMQGKLSGGEYHDHKQYADFAKSCVQYADALLFELEKPPQQ